MSDKPNDIAILDGTLRDLFAGLALAGFCACAFDEGEPLMGAADTAKAAYNYADAMLEARGKGAR
jgi:hypothetical protein